jgi:hypothetical protein
MPGHVMKDESKKKHSAVSDSHGVDGGEDRATRVNVGMRVHLATKGDMGHQT